MKYVHDDPCTCRRASASSFVSDEAGADDWFNISFCSAALYSSRTSAMISSLVTFLGDGDGERLGMASGAGMSIGIGVGEGVIVGEGEGTGDGVGDGEGNGEGEGEGKGVGEGEGKGVGEGDGGVTSSIVTHKLSRL